MAYRIKQSKTQNQILLLTFETNGTAEGQHEWFVSCFDNSSNFNQGNSSTYTFFIDVTPPNVTLLAPENNTKTPNNTLLFEYNVTDNLAVSNCSLVLNSTITQVNYSITRNISNNFSVFLRGGNYEWYVNCTDNASNFFASNTFYFNLTDPDLKVNDSDISFSVSSFVEEQNITIFATIYNIGSDNATDVTIQFFENDPDIDGIQIGEDIVRNISVQQNVTVNVTYRTKIGTVDIFVHVDPPIATNGSIIETNETNNVANRTISISPYHTFYGSIVNNILLDTSTSLTVTQWLNATNFTGNIYVTDSDSVINFNNLLALTRNTTNLTIDDLEELDTALNLTNLSVSINRSYRAGDFPRDIENFTVFSNLIESVPVINSTNTSNFLTGIVWDTSDANPGQFNGSQDVAFITRINQQQYGSYGTQDYEITVPANLRKYISPNLQDSISFYQEIT